jgi:Ca2+:H+ antiporter
LILGASTAVSPWASEILAGAIEPTAHEFGLSNVFLGLFIVAMSGNAAELATAVSTAMNNRMDLSLCGAIGSSVPIALFVAPVFGVGNFMGGPDPNGFGFLRRFGLNGTVLSVLITGQVAGDGRSDWLKGVQLLAV